MEKGRRRRADGRKDRTDEGKTQEQISLWEALFLAHELVAIVNLGGDFLLELLEFIAGQRSRQELGTPLHQLPHQPLDLLHTYSFVGLHGKICSVTL